MLKDVIQYMIASFFNILIQILLVIAILAAMVMVLLGVGHLFNAPDQKAEADMLKDEVERDDDTIADHSLFRQFLLSDLHKKPHDRSGVTDPSSHRQ